eukprot:GSMAST32.ASY1.ANO1.2153.1 assembled CDS
MLQAIKRSKAFQESNKFLDLVMKGLSDYLETKRAGFSRFYFLANDELLEILSETKDPTLVQPHLKKFHFDPEDNGITIQTAGVNVEDWMNDVETGMCLAIRARMWESIIDYTKISRTEWMQKWPVHWTSELEEFFDTEGFEGLKKYYQIQLNQLEDMVRLVRNPNLSKLGRTSTGALAVIDVHAKDVSKKMVANGVCSKNDFAWLTQLRYYWTDGDWKNGTPEGRPYSYEYLGNSFRLVITPLTDKCYITLMSAIENILGGAPAGPAGTGKTETVKDMAKGLAKQCVVFNCSDGMDFKMTAKFFKVLSVIAQQIMTLQDNLAALFQIMLFAYGFSKARSNAQKMVATFRLCSEQLSSQDHYDYGMRAVKTVIVAAGLIDGIMSDLFPGKKKPEIDYGALLALIQLYEMIVVRHGLMVVGPTGGGKSSNIYVLQDALTMLKEYNYINPKSITMGQLYGSFDPNTHEWRDGVLANMIRKLREKFDIYLHGSLNFLRRHIKEAVPSVNNNLAGSLMRFLDCFFAKYRYKDGQDPPTSEVMDKLMGHLDPIFMFTFVWSVAGTSDYNGRLKWDGYLRSLVNSAGTS